MPPFDSVTCSMVLSGAPLPISSTAEVAGNVQGGSSGQLDNGGKQAEGLRKHWSDLAGTGSTFRLRGMS
jgi:hypothetical protein